MAESHTSTARGPKRRQTLSDTEKYARLSSITGIIFAGLLVAAIVLVHSAPNLKASDAEFTAFYASSNTALVTVGLYLIPFAGIAFLWHMNTVRLLVRTRTPSPSPIPDGLQLMAGILFVALLFAGTASAGAIALLKDLGGGPLPSMDVSRGLLAVGYGMVFVYSVRGAGMYALTTTTLLANAKILPRWLAVIGYLAGGLLADQHDDEPRCHHAAARLGHLGQRRHLRPHAKRRPSASGARPAGHRRNRPRPRHRNSTTTGEKTA